MFLKHGADKMGAYKVNLKKAVSGKQSQLSLLSREEKFNLRWEMFNDNYHPQIVSRLNKIYSKVSELKLDQQIDSTNNVYKAIIDKVSRVYSFGVQRTFSNEDMEAIYQDIKVDKYLKQANKYVNAFNDVLLQVGWKDDKPSLRFRFPHKLKVHTNDFGDTEAVEYLVSSTEESEKWAYWSKESHYYNVYDSTGEITQEVVGNNTEMLNPYGVLPFVVMQKGFRDENFFDKYSGDDLVNITLDNAVYNTFKNYLIKWQTFKQLVISGTQITGVDGQMLDPSKALTVSGEDAKIDLLDLQANLNELSETLNKSVEAVALNYKISASSFNLTSQVTSGYSKAIENAALDGFTKEQQEDFMGYEKELHNLIVTIAEKEGVNLSGDFGIEINAPHYPESKSTQLDTATKEIELGLTNQVQIIMDQQGVDKEEAKSIYEENIKIRNQANNRFENTPTANIPINEGS